jgi:hypothetical protein
MAPEEAVQAQGQQAGDLESALVGVKYGGVVHKCHRSGPPVFETVPV